MSLDTIASSEYILTIIHFISTSLPCVHIDTELISYQCDDLSKYLRHTLVVHSAYICHECGRNFTTKSSLLRHRPIHTGMRRFACGICKKAFYRKVGYSALLRVYLKRTDYIIVIIFISYTFL